MEFEFLNWKKYQVDGNKEIKNPTWLRLENKLYFNPIWDALTDPEFRVFMFLLCFKSQKNNLESYISLDVGVISRLSGKAEADVKTAIEKMLAFGVIQYVPEDVRKLPETSGNFPATLPNLTLPNQIHTSVALLPASAELKTPEPIELTPDIVGLWNDNCGPLPKCARLTTKRRVAWRARWHEQPNTPYWQKIIQTIAGLPFYRGELPNKPWRATVDYLLRPDTHVKILEIGNIGPKEKPAKVRF